MSAKDEAQERFSLARWSRRKLDAAQAAPAPPAPSAAPATVAPAPVKLPPVETLSFDSDFTAFLRPEVDETLKRAALKQLFRDPRFNVMDGLDTYIDDYTKADPIPEDMLAGLLRRFASSEPEAAAAPAAPPDSGPETTPQAPESPVSPAGSVGNATAAGTEEAPETRAADDGDGAAAATPAQRAEDR
jgi:hypothetical protein